MENHRKKCGARLLLFIFLSILLAIAVCINKAEADQPLNAVPFTLNGQYSSDKWLTESETEHWYKLTIPSDGLLEIKIMSYCSGSLYYELWNEDRSKEYKFASCGNYVPAGEEETPTTGAVEKVVSKGIYYFRLSGSTGRYKLYGKHTSYKANDAGANSYDSPYVYTLGKSITGALTEMDTEDWYKIKLTKSGQYTFKLMSYTGSLYYTLYKKDLSANYLDSNIYGGSSTSPASKIEPLVLSKGTYYLKITGDSGKYKMYFKQKVVKKNLKLSVTAKKGKKYIVVKTTKNAKITAKYKNKKWKNVNSGSSGKVKLRYSKKLKKGQKVTVTVKKSGYKTKKKTFKVK